MIKLISIQHIAKINNLVQLQFQKKKQLSTRCVWKCDQSFSVILLIFLTLIGQSKYLLSIIDPNVLGKCYLLER